MAGSTTRGPIREQKIAGIDPDWIATVQQNTPERFQPASPVVTGSPYIDPTTGKPYPRG